MGRRELHALIFDLTPKPGRGNSLSQLVVWNPPGRGTCLRPESPKPWSLAAAGHALVDAGGERRAVPRVGVFRGFPADDVEYDQPTIGRGVTSGRAWSAGEWPSGRRR